MHVDATTAGLVGGFGGAIVGGLLTAAASWLTTSQQWSREHREKAMERLDEAVETALHAVVVLLRSEVDEEGTVHLPGPSAVHLMRLETRALAISPHLGGVIRRIGGQDVEDPRRIKANVLVELEYVLMDWSINPREYEKGRRNSDASRAYVDAYIEADRS